MNIHPLIAFLLDALPHQIYHNLMLRLRRLYFTHVVHIFKDSEMGMPEIKKMALGRIQLYQKHYTWSRALGHGMTICQLQGHGEFSSIR